MKKFLSIRMIWQKNDLFLSFIAALFSLGTIPLLLFDKISFFLFIKQWHHPIVDFLAPYLTWIGDGATYLCLLLIVALMGNSCRVVAIMGSSFFCTAVVVQLLKRVFFRDALRPILLIPIDIELHLVHNVELLKNYSFPSGHSATIFVSAIVLQLLAKNKTKHGFICLFLALAVSYSRIYLCQHFYIDVYIGALIGTTASIIVYLLLVQINRPYWLDRPVYFFIKRK